MPSLTLYDQLGGAEIVGRAVADFYERVVADDRLGPFFGQMDMSHQVEQQSQFLVMLLGGPNHYMGRSMREAHAEPVSQGLDDSHFDRVAGHLADAFRDAGAAESDVAEVVKLAGAIRSEVLGR